MVQQPGTILDQQIVYKHNDKAISQQTDDQQVMRVLRIVRDDAQRKNLKRHGEQNEYALPEVAVNINILKIVVMHSCLIPVAKGIYCCGREIKHGYSQGINPFPALTEATVSPAVPDVIRLYQNLNQYAGNNHRP
jgi:hypothetical protein